MADTRVKTQTRNIRDLIRLVDKNQPSYYQPYRFSKPRSADEKLDTPGPNVSEHSS